MVEPSGEMKTSKLQLLEYIENNGMSAVRTLTGHNNNIGHRTYLLITFVQLNDIVILWSSSFFAVTFPQTDVSSYHFVLVASCSVSQSVKHHDLTKISTCNVLQKKRIAITCVNHLRHLTHTCKLKIKWHCPSVKFIIFRCNFPSDWCVFISLYPRRQL